MKNIVILGFLCLIFGCQAQTNNHMKIINSFIESVRVNPKKISDLQHKGLLYVSESDLTPEKKAEIDSMHTIIVKSIVDQITHCNDSQSKIEILTIAASKQKKRFNENLEIPVDGQAYVLYCSDTIITRFLIRDGKIASFSVINKGGRKVFLLI